MIEFNNYPTPAIYGIPLPPSSIAVTLLPNLKKGRAATMTHDYKRHGTTTLFAALDVKSGLVIGECHLRRTSQTAPCPRSTRIGTRSSSTSTRRLLRHRQDNNPSSPSTPRRKSWLATSRTAEPITARKATRFILNGTTRSNREIRSGYCSGCPNYRGLETPGPNLARGMDLAPLGRRTRHPDATQDFH